MKSKPDDDEVSVLFRRLEDLQHDGRLIDEEQDAIVNRLKRLSMSSSQDDPIPMVKATAVPPTFGPGARVWIKKGTKYGGKGGVITSRKHRAGGIYWNIKLDHPENNKETVYIKS